MADENAYLQYEDGLVLHNGLPVKWLTYKPEWVDFPIILHFDSNFVSPYSGVTCPARGLSNNSLPGWSNRIKKTATGMSLDLNPQGGGRTSTGHITCLTGYDAYDAWLNTQAANPDYPFEAHDFQYYSAQGLTTFKYPAANTSGIHRDHYFGIDSQNALHPFDLSNHGSSGTSEVTRYYMPAATSIAFAFNASNFTAIRNLYAPNCTRISGWVGDWDEFWTGSSQVCELENITLGNFMNVVNNDSANRNIGLPTNPLSSVKNVVFRGTASGTKTNMAMKDNGIISGFSADIAVTMNGGTVYSAFARSITIPNCSADECGAITINNGRVKNTQGQVNGSNVTFETDSVHSVAVANPVFLQPNATIRGVASITGLGNGYEPAYICNDSNKSVFLYETTGINVVNANLVGMYSGALLRGDIQHCNSAILRNSEISGGITADAGVSLLSGSHVHGKITSPKITLDNSYADDLDFSTVLTQLSLLNGSSAASAKINTLAVTGASASYMSATSAVASAAGLLNCSANTFNISSCTANGCSGNILSAWYGEIKNTSANSARISYSNVSGCYFTSAAVSPNNNTYTNFTGSIASIDASYKRNYYVDVSADKIAYTAYSASTAVLHADTSAYVRIGGWSSEGDGAIFSAYTNHLNVARGRYISGYVRSLDGSVPVVYGTDATRTGSAQTNAYVKILDATMHLTNSSTNFTGQMLTTADASGRYTLQSRNILDLSEVNFINDTNGSAKLNVNAGTYIFNSAALDAQNIVINYNSTYANVNYV